VEFKFINDFFLVQILNASQNPGEIFTQKHRKERQHMNLPVGEGVFDVVGSDFFSGTMNNNKTNKNMLNK
jgi:hypothetical protein